MFKKREWMINCVWFLCCFSLRSLLGTANQSPWHWRGLLLRFKKKPCMTFSLLCQTQHQSLILGTTELCILNPYDPSNHFQCCFQHVFFSSSVENMWPIQMLSLWTIFEETERSYWLSAQSSSMTTSPFPQPSSSLPFACFCHLCSYIFLRRG